MAVVDTYVIRSSNMNSFQKVLYFGQQSHYNMASDIGGGGGGGRGGGGGGGGVKYNLE